MPEQSVARAEVKKWMRAQMGDSPVVSTGDLTSEAMAHFRNDPEFIEAFLNEGMPSLLHRCASEVMQSTRGHLRPGEVSTGHVRMTREEISRRAQNLRRFVTWREHVPAREGHVTFMEMTRTDLLSAAQHRRIRSAGELAVAVFEETLAARMTDDTKTVGETFSETELDNIYSALKNGEE